MPFSEKRNKAENVQVSDTTMLPKDFLPAT